MKRKICVVITARPSYSRVKTLLTAIRSHRHLELQLVVTSSALLEKYGSTAGCIERDGFIINAKVQNLVAGENPVVSAKTIGLGMIELSSVFENLKPHVVVTIADRFETMATAVCASVMGIPLAHIQGGEVSGNIDDKVRNSVTKLADLHFVATSKALNRVLRMGGLPQNVHKTGCPSIYIAAMAASDTAADFDPFRFAGDVKNIFSSSKKYFVVMQHPVTTEYESARQQIDITLESIRTLNIPTFWFGPNPDAGSSETAQGIHSFRERFQNAPIQFFNNIDSLKFLKLLKNAACLIGNSSTGIRECAYLGVPCVDIGSRQKGREKSSNVIHVDHEVAAILHAVQSQLQHGHYPGDSLYGTGNAGSSIADILATADLNF